MEISTIDFKKSLGQNFLFDLNLLRAIVKDGDVGAEDTVLEIGAGAGTLTNELCKVAKKVVSFEIDKSLKPHLDKVESENKNLTIIYADFMDFDLNNFNEKNARVVANIPYYITTPIIFKLIEHIEKFKSILVLIQKEVAERFSAKPNSKDYGITSVILQSVFDVSMPRVVKKECFTPSPKVDSALCKLVPNKKYEIANFEGFKNFVHQSFAMRRKTLINNLKNFYSKEDLLNVLTKYNYNPTVRPEQISVENFVNIFHDLNNGTN